MLVRDAFKEIIEQETDIIEQLIECGYQKQAVITDIEQLTAVVEQERELLINLEQAEQERCQLFDVIASDQSPAQWLAATDDQELVLKINQLKTKYEQLQELNQLNQQLLAESLAFVQYSLNLLVDDLPLTYSKPGTRTVKKSIIDRKV